jgi:hypothetical protein
LPPSVKVNLKSNKSGLAYTKIGPRLPTKIYVNLPILTKLSEMITLSRRIGQDGHLKRAISSIFVAIEILLFDFKLFIGGWRSPSPVFFSFRSATFSYNL